MPLTKQDEELDAAFLDYLTAIEEYAQLQVRLDEFAREVSLINYHCRQAGLLMLIVIPDKNVMNSWVDRAEF